MNSIEPLELRIAPASIVTFTDVDGDIITVKSSKGDLADALSFSAAGDVPRQLQVINFEQPPFIGTNLSVTAKQAGGGDGKVNVGQIRLGGGQAYGAFFIEGDLSSLGGGGAAGSIKSIVVGSLGMLGGSTQPGGVGGTFLQAGLLGSLEVRGHVASTVEITGDLKSLKVRGSLLGGNTQGSGFIDIGGKLGTGVVVGVLQGGLGEASGTISAGSIGALTVGGMRGGAGRISGAVFAAGSGEVGKLVVKGDVIGGTSTDARQIFGATFKTVQIDGSLFGGNGTYDNEPEQPGQIFSFRGYGSILIKGDVIGGNTAFSGAIVAGEDNVLPFDGQASLGRVTILGSLRGGSGAFSASLLGDGAPGGIRVGGSIIGGLGASSGGVFVEEGVIGAIVVGGSLIGGDGAASGRLEASTEGGSVGSITVRGSVLGGSGPTSGGIDVNEDGIGSVTVGGSIVGGIGAASGVVTVETEGEVASLKVVVGGSVRGGGGADSGGLVVRGETIGVATLRGSIHAGTGARSGFLDLDLVRSATVLGSVFGGLNDAGYISSQGALGTLTIGGSLLGVAGPARIIADPGVIAIPTAPLAGQTIGKLLIRGDVRNADILAGYDFVGGVLTATSADVQIGTVQVLGDWVASNLVAGVDDGADNRFGTADDALITASNDPRVTSRIASVAIGGIVLGIPGGTDAFGFVAQQIDAFRYTKRVLARAPIALDPVVTIGPTFDVFVREDE